MKEEDRNYLEVDLSAIRHNLEVIRGIIPPGCRIMSMLKGNGYGHFATESIHSYDLQSDCYGTASFDEAYALRNSGTKKPILIFGWIPSSMVRKAISLNFALNIFSVEYARYLEASLLGTSLKVDVHIEFDTGIGRAGIRCFDRMDQPQAVRDAIEIFNLKHVNVRGGFTHFSCIDSIKPEDEIYAENQHRMFKELVGFLASEGYHFEIKHCSSSTAILRHPEWDYDMVRAGKIVYGIGVLDEDKRKYDFRPAMTWKARIIQLKDIKPGESIGYGRTFIAKQKIRIAVLAVGYGDGYHRNYSNKTYVYIAGKRAMVLGAISMDFMVVDVSEISEAKLGGMAILLGKDRITEVEIPTNIFTKLGGANSEVTACITNRVNRYFLNKER